MLQRYVRDNLTSHVKIYFLLVYVICLSLNMKWNIMIWIEDNLTILICNALQVKLINWKHSIKPWRQNRKSGQSMKIWINKTKNKKGISRTLGDHDKTTSMNYRPRKKRRIPGEWYRPDLHRVDKIKLPRLIKLREDILVQKS